MSGESYYENKLKLTYWPYILPCKLFTDEYKGRGWILYEYGGSYDFRNKSGW